MEPVSPILLAISQYFLIGGLAVLPLLINQFSSLDQARDEIRSQNVQPPQAFDFIIGNSKLFAQ